jgi:hypothetical protein
MKLIWATLGVTRLCRPQERHALFGHKKAHKTQRSSHLLTLFLFLLRLFVAKN